MTNWDGIASEIARATGNPTIIIHATPISGGDINQAYCLEARDGTRYFVKINDAGKLPMFAAEHAGLEALAATGTVRVPRPIVHGSAGQHAFLVLEHLNLGRHGNARQMGEQLAALHRATSTYYGFTIDNTIGATPQPNIQTAGWIEFWREHRLRFQLQLAIHNGHRGNLQALGEQLMDALPGFFSGYNPPPSLLHGDLWGGNHAYLHDGTPVIFDPAPYYGDRETDLAMTELFGGFDNEFYAAYRAAWPLDPGYATRKTLYNLYHILNHANLFGGGYPRQAEGMMQRLLAEIG